MGRRNKRSKNRCDGDVRFFRDLVASLDSKVDSYTLDENDEQKYVSFYFYTDLGLALQCSIKGSLQQVESLCSRNHSRFFGQLREKIRRIAEKDRSGLDLTFEDRVFEFDPNNHTAILPGAVRRYSFTADPEQLIQEAQESSSSATVEKSEPQVSNPDGGDVQCPVTQSFMEKEKSSVPRDAESFWSMVRTKLHCCSGRDEVRQFKSNPK